MFAVIVNKEKYAYLCFQRGGSFVDSAIFGKECVFKNSVSGIFDNQIMTHCVLTCDHDRSAFLYAI